MSRAALIMGLSLSAKLGTRALQDALRDWSPSRSTRSNLGILVSAFALSPKSCALPQSCSSSELQIALCGVGTFQSRTSILPGSVSYFSPRITHPEPLHPIFLKLSNCHLLFEKLPEPPALAYWGWFVEPPGSAGDLNLNVGRDSGWCTIHTP